MAIDWKCIRTYNNSQNNAFEELVCQLARDEDISQKKEFYRIAAPDGGVEAYCVLNNGDEYGWQAKFFSEMGKSQWNQLTESFKTALEKHPKLKKYYICIPLDRQDPRINNQKWFMDRWNDKVQEWTSFALGRGREIVFEYWGSSELIHRLSQKKHAGRTLFWFSEEEFSDEWFENHLGSSISNLGRRYTPELNVELEIAKTFDFISRNDSFRKSLKEKFHELLLIINKAVNKLSQLPMMNELSKINDAKDNLELFYLLSQKREMDKLDLASIEKNINIIENALLHYERFINESKKENKGTTDYNKFEINNLWNVLYELTNIIQGKSMQLTNHPILLLSGPAGAGKSHLLADIATNKMTENKACVLLLGQHFSSEESPWTQILRNLLRVNCNESELLGALNAKAEAQGERLLFIIDAINEGRGKYFWPQHIRGFVKDFKKYPWLGLVLSIRSTYDRLIVQEEIISNNKIIKINHSGFQGIEYYASGFFFSQYNIEQPSVPLLHPEFSNPLFLKLFCEGLFRAGMTKIPKGYGGISSIIDFFIEGIDNKLSMPSYFDYPSGRKLVRRVIDGLIEYKLKNELEYVTYEDAYAIADKLLSKFSDKRRFLDALISEGVLSKNLIWVSKGQHEEYVYLAYERFEDHFTASHLLDSHLDNCDIETIFKNNCNGMFAGYIDNLNIKQGILDALSIQIPERTDKELYELVDDKQKASRLVKESFINSLIWRKPETIKESTKEYVNKYLLGDQFTFNLFFQMVYSVSTDPNHFYNADSLHNFLMKFTLAERDSFWTTYLQDQYHEETSIVRLITWAKSNKEKLYLLEDSRLLAAKAISWIFTSTNILFRDSATKALVVLLENNLRTATSLLIEFEKVNDPYVYERIISATYGAVLRSEELDGLKQLSEYIIDGVFNKEEVYPNVLVRDYAKNIIEYAQYKGYSNIKNLDIIRPPYKSSFPATFPTNEEIDLYRYDYKKSDFQDYYWAQNSILGSMVTEYGRGIGGYGDFGRYIFQSAVSNWDNLDPNDLSNYACKLIFEKYGYDVEKHGRYDRNVVGRSRYNNKIERIGKKYQWLALYEVLARLSDNYQMVDESYWGEEKNYIWYQGPWEPFVRNIDPTVVHYQSKTKFHEGNFQSNLEYSDWNDTNENWLIKTGNLPDPKSLISVTDSKGNEWVVLEDHLSWEEPVPIGKDKNNYPRKRLWYQIRSYLIKEEGADELLHWLKGKNFMGRWFPEGHDQYQVFSREFYWSPAYQFFNNPYYGGHNWEEVHDKSHKAIANVLPTTEGHRWESGADYENQPSYLAPREYIFTGMNLQYSNNIGEWLDVNGQIVCFDHKVKTGESPNILIKKEVFLEFLKENKLRFFWTCLGEKQILGGSFNQKRYLKWLELSGVYYLSNGKIDGELNLFIEGVK
ncbi:hypothetical protein CN481_22120 [Bacillus sp. AFS006103]|nr:hypothetical protein CN481_22120 [Bacillus sp. AFS006103]